MPREREADMIPVRELEEPENWEIIEVTPMILGPSCLVLGSGQ
jgi:hypothetical protein